ncbi:hypothetical protein ABT390_35210 [Streptomyces aurantiacus]|uniref:Uncharacterized protein n=1 Tax=Streptomyces aurantiacus JA 4570 TaxID=1286094 RepID=S3ZH72_9ACTN|nr:hypothetical protein [Streptomyces aurantiacus]EPH42029.1 hypothetical protein STRAU_4916 [Streptomyces aurantiacus JA 4570]
MNGGSANGGSANGGSSSGGTSGSGGSGSSGRDGATWDPGSGGGSTWKPGRTDGGRGDGGSGGDRDRSTEPPPEKEFSWPPFGPNSPQWNSVNTDHVYDLVQSRKCAEARYKYNAAGPERWQSNPAPWKVLEGLIAACHAVGGQEDEWRKVIDAYSAVRNTSSGDCKFRAGHGTLKALAEFRVAHPNGRVRIRPASNGVRACPAVITRVSDRKVARGTRVSVTGTWPSAVTIRLGSREPKVEVNEGNPDAGCCHNATVNFHVPADMPTGGAPLTLTAGSVTLDGGTIEITAPRP